jgi:intraflagellar transport protein 172
MVTYNLETKAKTKLKHSSIPYALAWGSHIMAGGNDGKIGFYEPSGDCFQRFDYSKDEKVKEFTCAAFNATGETAVVGNFNRFYVYNFNSKRPQWDEICCKQIENYYSVTAVAWKADGSRIGIGSLCGSVDVFDVCLKKSRYKGKFEFTYVSLSQVIVKKIETGQRLVLKSAQGHEISKINIYQDRYLVATTHSTLLLGDLESCKLSELPWRGSGNEKFDFSNPNICMVFNAGELSIVEYGVNEVIGTCRTENMGPNMISARLNYSEQELRGGQPTKIIAYLLDSLTICIQDLRFNQIQATVNHDSKIDYLELNPGGNKLLFRDKRRQLHLYNIKEQRKQTLLNYCKYVSWVPNSDVVVAQNRNNLCVWYSIEEADKVTMYQIKGDVESIERTEGRTEVLVDDGANTVSYNLDEALIEFGAALEYKGLDRAVEILEPLELTPETEANWKTVAKMALEQQNLYVAERCYAALGNIAKADYLRKVNKLVAQEGINNFRVQAKLAVLDKQFHKAEAILIQHDEIEEAMAMYQELHRWDESIKIAEKKNHPDVREFKENYFQWLLETNQEAKAAEVKEREGDYNTAISLYLKGGLPAKAANVVSNFNVGVPQD